jgi:lipopolysaccharide transport system ATP-binding protein
MSETVIEVSNLSKMYRLGIIGSGSLRKDLQRFWNTSILKKQDTTLLFETEEKQARNKEILWALQDVNFEVKRGDAIGIIGSNGSGKSTLLKIISRIVKPTRGTIKGKGKVSSLLEIGTGFHEDLSGRENIFLSGYILGMSKREIKSKFDEIVAFSNLDRFIDTPVKRYSSGMYVRLAFAVAAHLEPDILIVDEVLAVGDADFQKKCLGKMQDVSKSEGRTILFVSHSMQAIANLCNNALWLQQGRVREMGEASYVVNKYISGVQKHRLQQSWDQEKAPGNEMVRFIEVELIPELNNQEDIIDIRTPLTVKYKFWSSQDNIKLSSSIVLFSYSGECIFDMVSPSSIYKKGFIEAECKIPGNFLNDGSYFISLNVVKDTSIVLFSLEECLSFDVEDYRGEMEYFGKWWGAVRPKFPFYLKQPLDSTDINPS